MPDLKWDHYSDQPDIIRDKAFKKHIVRQTRWASIKMILSNLLLYPIVLLYYFISRPKKHFVNTPVFFGMGVNLDKNPQETPSLIEDLGVKSLLIRMPLSDIEKIDKYVDFAQSFKHKEILINILQDRRHVENLSLLKESLETIFEQFSAICNRFQIGNAVNRKKWAFFSMDEYLRFYQVAYQLKKNKYPSLTLLGPSVIDFEYYYTLRTLFNFYPLYYEQCSSLLYVDRRGAPENTQMGLDLTKKLYLLQAMLRLSLKSGTGIVITETNWPIQNTAPYAPTGEKECVSLEDHANYLVRYYLLALASGVVLNVYWHQLIAPGYGLMDNREGKLIKYPAYSAFKTMLSLLSAMKFVNLKVDNKHYHARFKSQSKTDETQSIDVYWSLTPHWIKVGNRTIISRNGEQLENSETIEIGESPVYLITKEAGNRNE